MAIMNLGWLRALAILVVLIMCLVPPVSGSGASLSMERAEAHWLGVGYLLHIRLTAEPLPLG